MKEYELETRGLRLVNEHINRVQNHMKNAVSNLIDRLANHDQSKFGASEVDLVTGKPRLDSIKYNSKEYKAALNDVQDAIQHHYKHNSHHPEHYPGGVEDMSLLDLLEMACDWKAASEMSPDGSYLKSINRNVGRFNLSLEMQYILMNTGRELGWINQDSEGGS